MIKAKVKLMSFPEDTKQIIYTACRTCYSNECPEDIYSKDFSEDKMIRLILDVINSGHTSTLEHAHYVFSISGCSRAFSHQFVRMRHMSFSQRSQRYCSEDGNGKGFDYITPPSISVREELLSEYIEFMNNSAEFYKKLQDAGIPNEDARFILPNACSTAFTCSLNLREMIHIANLRLCQKSQWEFRKIFKLMVDEVLKVEPWLEDYLVPKCEVLGYCNEEKRSCGRKIVKSEAMRILNDF